MIISFTYWCLHWAILPPPSTPHLQDIYALNPSNCFFRFPFQQFFLKVTNEDIKITFLI